MDKFSFLNAAHSSFIEDLYEKYLQYPDSIEPSWKSFFQGYDLANSDFSLRDNKEEPQQIPEHVHKEFQVIEMINAYRSRGHLFTKTNPVRSRRTYLPTLDIENFGLTKEDLNTLFEAANILNLKTQTLQEIIGHLNNVYCDSIGAEYMFIRNPEEIKWWRQQLHKNDNQPKYSIEQKNIFFQN